MNRDEALTVEQVFPTGVDRRIKAFRCLGFVDAYVVVTDRFVVVIDTLVSPQAIGKAVALVEEDLQGKPDRKALVVNTHGDWDHVWGNAFFGGPNAALPAPIIGSGETRRRFDPAKAEAFLAESRSRHPQWYADVAICLPTIEFVSSLIVRGGDLSLELWSTPGHTPDHVSVWVPELRLLFAGDAAELPLPYIENPATLPRLRSSLQRMLDLEPAAVLYSHGGGVTSPRLIRHNLWYLDEVERRCAEAIDSGRLPAGHLSAEALDWPLEDVMPFGLEVSSLFSPEFYRDSHGRAIRAMANWLSGSGGRAR